MTEDQIEYSITIRSLLRFPTISVYYWDAKEIANVKVNSFKGIWRSDASSVCVLFNPRSDLKLLERDPWASLRLYLDLFNQILSLCCTTSVILHFERSRHIALRLFVFFLSVPRVREAEKHDRSCYYTVMMIEFLIFCLTTRPSPVDYWDFFLNLRSRFRMDHFRLIWHWSPQYLISTSPVVSTSTTFESLTYVTSANIFLTQPSAGDRDFFFFFFLKLILSAINFVVSYASILSRRVIKTFKISTHIYIVSLHDDRRSRDIESDS